MRVAEQPVSGYGQSWRLVRYKGGQLLSLSERLVMPTGLMRLPPSYCRILRHDPCFILRERLEKMKFVLKLYVAGRTPRTERAIANLRSIFDSAPNFEYQLAVQDVCEQPHLADSDRILATPALVLVSPPPAKRVVGDLDNLGKVVRYLGLPITMADETLHPHEPGSNEDGDHNRG